MSKLLQIMCVKYYELRYMFKKNSTSSKLVGLCLIQRQNSA